MKNYLSILLIFLLIIPSMIYLQGCGKNDYDKRLKRIRSGEEKLNILIITVDTTRKDAFSCYSDIGAETPNIDALAREGVLFKDVRCQVPLTLPSHTSIFTGTNPYYHSVHNHEDYVSPELVTMAEIMKENGYNTGAFISAKALYGLYGINQGFDDYMDTFPHIEKIEKNERGRLAENTFNDALLWLSEKKDEPFFLWIHLYDPHLPYISPKEFEDKYENPYYAEVAYVDQEFGKFFKSFKEMGLEKNTLVILTSDHGEALGEHSEYGHGYFLYKSTLEIPLIIWCPGLIPENSTVDGLVRSIDIMPTILDIYGIDSPESCEGESFLGTIYGKEDIGERYSYFESYRCNVEFGWAKLAGIEKGDYKLIVAPDSELYNTKNDLNEDDNILNEEVEVVQELNSLLDNLMSTEPVKSTYPVDSGLVNSLSADGYISGGVLPTKELERTNPMKEIDVFEVYFQFRETQFNNDIVAGEELLIQLIEMTPQVSKFREMLGEIYIAKNEPDKARAQFEECLDINPRNTNALLGLGQIHLQIYNDVEKAEYYFNLIFERSPEDMRGLVSSYVGLAQCSIKRLQFEKAREYLEKALLINPDDINANLEMADLLLSYGDKINAVKHLERVKEMTSPNAREYDELVKLLAELKGQ